MQIFGTPLYLAKFTAAATAVLIVGGGAISLYFHRVELAVACSIVGAWSIMMFFEIMRHEISEDIRRVINEQQKH